MLTRKALGARIRFWREQAGLTQEELADRTGLTQHWISMIETGARYPSVETLYELVTCLGCEDVIFSPFEENGYAYQTSSEHAPVDCHSTGGGER